MTVAAAFASPHSLVALLERELTPLIESSAPAVESRIWSKSLTDLAREMLARPGKMFRARLLEQAFLIAGGKPGELSPTVPLLVELLHVGSLIVDDIQDDSPMRRGGPSLHVTYGMPQALNAGNWLYFAAFELAGGLQLPASEIAELYRSLSRCLFRCHQGQALDLAIDVSTARQRDIAALAEAATRLKTGALVGFSAELGGRVARADTSARKALSLFGTDLGIGLQRLDDIGGLLSPARAEKGLEDLACGRLTWVWAHLATHLDDIHFAKLQARLRRARSERGGARREGLRSVASQLSAALDERALKLASSSLAAALEALTSAFPGHSAIDVITDEITRLEASYI